MAKNSSNEFGKLGGIALGAIIVAFLVAVAASVFWLEEAVNSAHRQGLVRDKVHALEKLVNLEQQELIKQLQRVATSPDLADVVRSGDPQAKAIEEARLEKVIADAIKVRLFRPGEARVQRNANPPFTYTSLDLVNRAQEGSQVYPEAIKLDDRWILSVAAALSPADGSAVFGTLFVYLDMDAIADGLHDEIDGQMTISQTFPNAPTNEILKIGEGSEESLAATRDLDNPNWQMRYTPSARIASATVGDPVQFAVPLLLFLLIALIGVLLGARRAKGAIESDATLLSNQVTSVINGDFEQSSAYHFATFIDIDANLVRLGRKVEEPAGPVAPVKSATPRAQPKREEMVDIEMIDEADYRAELAGQAEVADEAPQAADNEAGIASIFRAYDIRGIINETLTPEVIKKIGLAIGTEAGERGQQVLLVGADGRVSSPAVSEILIEALLESGRDVINIGQVPTPLLYYATRNSTAKSGVMITGSHNPAEYNGFKIVIDGRTLVEQDVQQLYQRFIYENFSSGKGKMKLLDVRKKYLEAVCNDVVVSHPLKVIVDCGNGIAGNLAPELIANLGCDVVPLYCEIDGTFPNHHPDPTVPENLDDLIMMVKSQKADIGIALDGDGDRLVAVTNTGTIVWPDRLLMLFARDVVSRNPGTDVVYDVKCSRHLNPAIRSFGGRPISCRTGHSFLKEKMLETGASLGGEFSGHICFSERWNGFDDGLYAAARLLEIVGSTDQTLEQLLREFPSSVATPEIFVAVPDERKFELVHELTEDADFGNGTITTADGLKVEFTEGWGLVRASNTNPALTLRFEADNEAGLQKIMKLFRDNLQSVEGSLNLQPLDERLG